MESANRDVPERFGVPQENVPEDQEENISGVPEENVPEDQEENDSEDQEENVPEDQEENDSEDQEENVPEDQEENVPEDQEEITSATRHGLLSCLHRCLSEVAIFFSGLMFGVPGGVLLVKAAILVLRSLELLAEDKLVMDHIVSFMTSIKDIDLYLCAKLNIERKRDNLHIFNLFASILTEEFGGLVGICSSVAGLAVGWLMYGLVMKTSAEGARGKALSVAGPLSLTVISAVGCLLGHLLHMYLSISLTVIICFFFVLAAIGLFFICMKSCSRCSVVLSLLTVCALSPLNTPIIVCSMFLIMFVFQGKLNLSFLLSSKMSPLMTIAKSYGANVITTPLNHFLLTTDVFNFARQPIVILQQTNATSTDSTTVEGLFIGVLSAHFLMLSVGMSLFTLSEITGAGKICGGAAALGAAVLTVLESAVPVLGPGPTIGALMGVAGAVGVSLTAAVVAAFRYGLVMGTSRLVGVLGVTAGAAVAAYLTSYNHSGLSALYMCLSAATIPGSLVLTDISRALQRHFGRSTITICLFLLYSVRSAVWMYFIVPIENVLTFIAFMTFCTAASLVLLCVCFAFDFRGLNFWRNKWEDESDPSSPKDQVSNDITELVNMFSLEKLSAATPDLYNEVGSKLVHYSEGLLQRSRSSQSNRALDSM